MVTELFVMIRIVALGMVAVAASVASAQTLYVDDDALPGGDGSSWATAYEFLQDALADAAAAGGAVTEVHVAEGSYTPDRDEANPDGGISNCCVATGDLGCADSDCESVVCMVFPLCCELGWDATCADAAVSLCGDLCTDIRSATFQLIDGVALMGGFAGVNAPDPDERDIGLYETLLSGDLLGDDGPGNFENNQENA